MRVDARTLIAAGAVLGACLFVASVLVLITRSRQRARTTRPRGSTVTPPSRVAGRRKISNGVYHTNFTIAGSGRGRASTRTIPLPLFGGADPGLYFEGGRYYAACTGWGSVKSSADLVAWRDEPGGIRPNGGVFWAPEILKLGGTYWMPYCDGFNACKFLKASKPGGPYAFSHQLAVSPPMDPHVFVDMDGKLYVFTSGINVGVVVHEISADLKTLGKSATVIAVRAQPSWMLEPVAEAPQVLARVQNGKPVYYCVFSANRCCTVPDLYSMGYCTAPHPLGPWTPAPENPIVKHDGSWGYGHHCFGVGPNGNLFYMCQRESGENRQIVLASAHFAGDKLVMKKPGASSAPQP